jgi:hypothetical protein
MSSSPPRVPEYSGIYGSLLPFAYGRVLYSLIFGIRKTNTAKYADNIIYLPLEIQLGTHYFRFFDVCNHTK